MAKAADVWEAVFVEDAANDRAANIAGGLVAILLGGSSAGTTPGFAVVRRRDNGDDVLRGRAGEDTRWMIDRLQRDLRAMTQEQFLAKWGNTAEWSSILSEPRA